MTPLNLLQQISYFVFLTTYRHGLLGLGKDKGHKDGGQIKEDKFLGIVTNLNLQKY